MLRIRECILSRILHPASPPFTSLHRLLSATAAPVPPKPGGFELEDYLVATCGLTRPQALKASGKLARLKSPSKPDAVLAFLRGLGLSDADVAALVVKDPRFLSAGVERTLRPKVVDLNALGMSTSEIARFIPLAHCRFRSRSIVSKLQYFLQFSGSFENLLRVLTRRRSRLLSCSLDNVVKPNVALLRECGLDECAIVKMWFREPSLFVRKPEHILTMVKCAKDLGVPIGSGMFPIALAALESHGSEEKIAAKVECLKTTFRWSDAQVRTALCRAPALLRTSKEMMQRRSEFLLSEVGLEPAYIAWRPIMLCLSLEGRLKPRYYVDNFLKANGLGHQERGYSFTFCMAEKEFLEKIIGPHNEAVPHLAEDYAAACRGEVPSRLRFT